MSVATPTTPAAPPYPADVAEYVRRHGLEAAVRETERLVGEVLPPGSGTEYTVEGDGESDSEWLIAHVAVRAPIEELYHHSRRIVAAWVRAVDSDDRDHIRLTYNVR